MFSDSKGYVLGTKMDTVMMRGAFPSSFIIILILLLHITTISALIDKSFNTVKLSDNKYNRLWNTAGYKGKNNIDSSSNRSGGHTNQGDVNSRPSSTNRRKLGPPQRKLVDKNDISSLGRVSVYCVGSSINLLSLRAHVFRRGFSYNYYSKNKLESDSTSSSSNASSTDSQDDVMASLPNLMLSRRPEDVALDEEVLHISNAPSLYLSSALQSSSYNSNNNHYNGPPSKTSSSSSSATSSSTTIDTSTLTTTSAGGIDADTVGNSDKNLDSKDSVTAATTTDPSLNNDPNYYNTGGDVANKASSSSLHTDDSSEEAPLTRTDRQLVMLTQDIFYFEYGCVVFWGLSQR